MCIFSALLKTHRFGTNLMKKKNADRLAIISGYPPPYGGVTTHIMRLCGLLDETSLEYTVYNAISASEEPGRVVSIRRFRRLWILWYALTGKESAVYLASQRIVVWLAGAFMASWRGKKVAIRLQNAKVADRVSRGGFHKAIIGFAMRRLSAIVCVNNELAEAVKSIGVDPRKVHVFPGFLPPLQADRDPGRVAKDVWDFCQGKSPVIAANGKVGLWKGEDLYGLDHLICLAERLKPRFPNVGIVVCFWHHLPEDQPRLNQLISLAKENGLEQNILFNTKSGLFVPVIEKADLFVRPTNTDGDANSIREALFFGIPVVASDVVKRPEGTIEFRTRNMEDFEQKVLAVLTTTSASPQKPLREEQENIKQRIDSYLKLLSGLVKQH